MKRATRKVGRPRLVAPRPVIAFRVQESIYADLVAIAKQDRISISQAAARRIERSITDDRAPMQYLSVRPERTGKIGEVGDLLTHLSIDRGWKVVLMTPHFDGSTEYLMARPNK